MCDQQRLRQDCAYVQSDQSLCKSLEYSMIVKLLTQHHLEFLSFKGGCRGSSEPTLVKMTSCWKSHVTAHMFFAPQHHKKSLLLWFIIKIKCIFLYLVLLYRIIRLTRTIISQCLSVFRFLFFHVCFNNSYKFFVLFRFLVINKPVKTFSSQFEKTLKE